jgi:two-component system, cell cycle sensor histidine kinase and response regulator CckA
MPKRLRVLNVEDSPRDAALLQRHLSRNGYDLVFERVDTPLGMTTALKTKEWDVVLADYSMPEFSALKALAVLRQTGLDIPFIVISGTIGEELAVEVMRAGASDYLMKGNLTRLSAAVERELEDARSRHAKRRAEEEMIRLGVEVQRQRDRLNAIIASVPGVVWEAWGKPDASTQRIDFVSDHVQSMVGYSVQEWLSTPNFWLSIVHPDDKDQAAREAAAIFNNKQGGMQKFRWIARDGRVLWVESNSVVLTDENGEPVGMRGVTVDITARKEAEGALREKELMLHATDRRLADILHGMTDACFSLDTKWRFTFVNDRCQTMLGHTREEMLGRSIWEVFQKLVGTPMEADYRSAMKERIPVAFEAFSPIAERWLNVRIFPTGEGLAAFLLDISARKSLEDQFRQAQKMEAFGQLAGGVAHDFNNLLTVINGYSTLLLDRLPEADSNRGFVQAIITAGERSAALTRQLLVFSRREIISPKLIDLNAVIANVEKMLRRIIGEDVELATAPFPGLGTVRADPSQIEQMIMNLAVNARDAMPTGGRLRIAPSNVDLDDGWADRQIEIQPGRYVVLTISDTGIGMTEDVQKQMFEPFFTTKEMGKGTGLGLAVVHGVLEQAAGQVHVHSEPGVGTTFTIYLPRVDMSPSEEKPGTKADAVKGGSETILLVEDDEAVRSLTYQILASFGYKVLLANDGQEGLLVAEEHKDPIHLLITDVVMPRMGGRQLAEILLLRRPTLQVLYLSGYMDDAVVRHGILQHQVFFLQKPFTPSALALKVRSMLDTFSGE